MWRSFVVVVELGITRAFEVPFLCVYAFTNEVELMRANVYRSALHSQGTPGPRFFVLILGFVFGLPLCYGDGSGDALVEPQDLRIVSLRMLRAPRRQFVLRWSRVSTRVCGKTLCGERCYDVKIVFRCSFNEMSQRDISMRHLNDTSCGLDTSR